MKPRLTTRLQLDCDMKTQLKDFQEEAVTELAKRVRAARRGIEEEEETAAVTLSSPTGSGKTVTLCALLERIWNGAENFAPDSQARFLWLSDSPQLNEQSRDKFEVHSDVFGATRREIIESGFDQEIFDAGKIYFLNTQKLTKDGKLLSKADERQFTIWETIANTAKKFPSHFYLVIDEAHRGMSAGQHQAIKEARTIVQRFILGYPEEKVPPIPLIIGMSATPERFQNLIAKTSRVPRPYEIDVQKVVASGLLKETVVVAFPEGASGNVDYTLLEQAVDDLARYRRHWAKYCIEQKEEGVVEPCLVVQVQDGHVGSTSETDLEQVVKIIDRRYFEATNIQPPAGFFAHCFQDDQDFSFGGHNVRKIEPSRVQNSDAVRVVFFKTALSTGWDCPRAEVMMSFRPAHDKTNIAQLVGRMVRTPLARRVEKDEWLNTVRLYLPHYNRAGVEEIVAKLKDPGEDGVMTEVVVKGQEKLYARAAGSEAAFEMLKDLPSYRVVGAPKKANTARLRTLARTLVMDKIHDSAEKEAKALIVDELWKIWSELDPLTKMGARLYAQFKLSELNIAYGTVKATAEPHRILEMVPENIEQLFEQCGRKLTNGIHCDFEQKYHEEPEFEGDPFAVRLALILMMSGTRREDTIARLEKLAGEQVSAWFKQFKAPINALPEGKRKKYETIHNQSRTPEADVLRLPDTLEGVKNEGDTPWPRHLFDEDGQFWAKFTSSWETAVLERELDNKKVLFWLRNLPRKPWAFCFPYQLDGEDKPCFPDFLFVRESNGALVCDVIDPHYPGKQDAVAKAVGLARFAENHGLSSCFDRIELVAEVSGQLKRIDLMNDQKREQVKKVDSSNALIQLYESA